MKKLNFLMNLFFENENKKLKNNNNNK